jgi:ferredoxin
MLRKIIKINDKKCTGCGLCIPNCSEGALQIVEGKARLMGEHFCDGLGACIGHCPEGAISVEEREAEQYDEKRVMENVVRQGSNGITAHLRHLKEHGQDSCLRGAIDYLKEKGVGVPVPFDYTGRCEASSPLSQCPGARVMALRRKDEVTVEGESNRGAVSRLGQWPVQIMLVPLFAPYFRDADLLISADCVPFACGDFHERILKGRVVLVGCPKLDDAKLYLEKLAQIFARNTVRSVTVAHMEVPCCFALTGVVRDAVRASGKEIPFHAVEISIRGAMK